MAEYRPVSELRPHPLNLRVYGEETVPEDFLASVRQKGIMQPLAVKPDGTIISGHRRWRAALALKMETVPVQVVTYADDLDEREALLEFNRQREKTFSQRMAEAEELKRIEAERAEARRLANLKRGDAVPDVATFPPRAEGKTRDKVAVAVGIGSGRTYDKAAKVWEAAKAGDETAQQLVEKLDKGQTTVNAAFQELKRTERQEQAGLAELPSGKYRVIYADPPWKYGNTMPAYFTEQADHYPLMTVEQICAMPIADLAEDNAVLFLWATSPILEEAFDVIRAWGFKYKASFVWDKVKHVMGHYNSVRHEFLLIAVRGSCQPDQQRLFDSVVSIERTEHSAKPEYFREIIDTLYTHGRRIELFARRRADGWDCYGNELPQLS
ncbi:MAG: MT-A70 family methyltransferase [Pseudomonadota bacterium]